MATVHFYGEHYAGFDGPTEIYWNQPGLYEVSEAKAAQLVSDFPDEFKTAVEGEVVTEEPSAASKSEEVAPDASQPATEPETDSAAPEGAEDADKATKKGKKE